MDAKTPDARPLSDRIRRRARRDLVDPLVERVVMPARRWRNRSRTYAPVFVAGVMGSGTSLLALALGQRFEVAGVVYESALQVGPDSFLHVRHPDTFASAREYARALEARPEWTLDAGRAHLQRLYRGCARRAGRVIVDKGPNTNLVRAGYLARCFPEGRFVLIFRDPVANLEGLRRKWQRFASDPLEASLEFYRSCHERFLSETAAFRDRVAAVEYETLVQRHDETLVALGGKLGLEPARRSRRLASRPNVEGQGIRNVRRGRIVVVADANLRAESRLDAETASAIRTEFAPLYRRLRALTG